MAGLPITLRPIGVPTLTPFEKLARINRERASRRRGLPIGHGRTSVTTRIGSTSFTSSYGW